MTFIPIWGPSCPMCGTNAHLQTAEASAPARAHEGNACPWKCLGPRSCEIRNRRLLHGVGDKSPPQCSPDGEFLPVQCKFVNTTDMMVFDLVHSYNR